MKQPNGPCRVSVYPVGDQSRAVTVCLKRSLHAVALLCHIGRLLLAPCYFYPWLLIFHSAGVSFEPCHRPLWWMLSPLTSACPSLLCNQRSSQMSRWDKWEPIPSCNGPRNGLECFSSAPSLYLPLLSSAQDFSSVLSFRGPFLFLYILDFYANFLLFSFSPLYNMLEFLALLC